MIRLPVENTKDIFIEGRNPESKFNKRNLQHTPINSNLQNYIENFRFETPNNMSSGKLLKFATPSSGGESLTTATSMRKLSQKMGYAVSSPLDSRGDSINTDFTPVPRYTPGSTKKDLLKQSLERIDNAVKRYGQNYT